MKRMIAYILTVIITSLLAGCASAPENEADTVTLYYVRAAYQYHSVENVIVGEQRTVTQTPLTPDQRLSMYMAGPTADGLVSPIPEEVQVLEILNHSGLFEVTFSDTEQLLSDARFSLACVCLGKTLFEDPDIIQLTVISGERTMTVSKDSYLLIDEVGAMEPPKEVTP